MSNSPYELWNQAYREKHNAGGTAVRDRFRELMREHGHLVDAKPGQDRNLPCGWPGVPPLDDPDGGRRGD